jgi:hypothetical protein
MVAREGLGTILSIGRRYYRAIPIETPEVGFGIESAVRMVRLDTGDVYDVTRMVWGGFECTCGDAVFKSNEASEQGCKHARAAVKCDLI